MNKKVSYTLVLLAVVLAACGSAPTVSIPPSATASSPTPTPLSTVTPTLGPTPAYPPNGLGPDNFPAGVDALTGLWVTDPALLERRPLAIKVANIPRYYRPHWGLSQADLVFEYYTEEGATRFLALFYGRDSEIVGPVRSARLLDIHVVRGYKAVFAFGSGSDYVLDLLFGSEFSDLLVVEGPNSPLSRYDPNGQDLLVANTATLSAFITSKGVENGRQNLDGMFFRLEPPAGGQPAEHISVRYSSAVYNRWDYDASTARYLRFSDTANDFTNGLNEQYTQLTDRLTGQPIAFDNLVVLLVTYEAYSQETEIWDILLYGSGSAYAFRDGQVYQVKWQRNDTDVVTLTYPDGTPFPFKPGTTWFEVVGTKSQVQQTDQTWRFTHLTP